jgi:hypothetical protein
MGQPCSLLKVTCVLTFSARALALGTGGGSPAFSGRAAVGGGSVLCVQYE